LEKRANSEAPRRGGQGTRLARTAERFGQDRWIGLVIALGVLLVVAMSLGGVLRLNWQADDGRAPASVIPAPTIEPSLLDEPEQGPLSPFSRRSLGHATRFTPEPEVVPPFELVTGTQFSSGTVVIALAGIEGPPRNAICLDSMRQKWSCGLQARAALSNLLRQGPVACRRAVPVADTPAQNPVGTVLVDCMVGAQDLAAEIVRLGFGRLVGLAGADRIRAQEAARFEGRGLWNGDWTILP
jgi:endonuclease YncB( thermonuclease family)